MSDYAGTYGTLYPGTPPPSPTVPNTQGIHDSLVIGEQIELIGPGGAAIDSYGTPSLNPLCAGAVYRLIAPTAARGGVTWDLGSPQPTTDVVGSLLLDGERPYGYRSSNRTITLPIIIKAPSFQALVAAREVLLKEIDQQTWTLRWTRDVKGPYAGNPTPLPLLFDCFRAQPTVNEWGDFYNRIPYGVLTVTFQALPYARSDKATIVDFPMPLQGRPAPPAPIAVDTFASVSGAQWSLAAQSPNSTQSAYWDPGASPADEPDGVGQVPYYSAVDLDLNLAAGWSAPLQATGTTTSMTVLAAAGVGVGQQFQLWSAGSLLQAQIFTVTSITEASGANVTATFTPAAAAATTASDTAIQTAPPGLSALTVWAGFGSSKYYHQWARLGGRVTFAFTLTDTYATTIQFAATVKCYGSNQSASPRWQRIRAPIPYNPVFDYQNVAAYSVTVTNRSTGDLRYTQLYLSGLNAQPIPATDPNLPATRGAVYEIAGVAGTARSPVSVQAQQTGTTTVSRSFSTAGTFGWLCPPGVTSVSVFAVGGGGAGFQTSPSFGGGGGGGAGSAANASVPVTPGNTYTVAVGQGGNQPGVTHTGNAPGDSVFTGDSGTVVHAHGGFNSSGRFGGGAGAAGTGGFAGGTGGTGTNASNGGGGSGGASGGSAAAGGAGNNASGGTGGAAVAAVTGGGGGGRGGTFGFGNGINRGCAPGGGSGGSPGGASGGFYGGAAGIVQLTYTQPASFQTLLLHRPPPTGSESFSPVLPVSVSDPVDGSAVYTLIPLGAVGINAVPRGTYSVAVSAWSWNTPSAARTITVTVTQWEQPGGASYTSSCSVTITPNLLPNTTGTNATYGPIVIVGELTLPVQDLPQDNIDGYFTASITDTNTSDSFSDILFLDTMGSTVLIQSPTGYANYFIDEPASDRDLGLIMGSLFDRGDAVSILDRATVTGGPLAVIPDSTGNPYILAYCAEGLPNLQMSYFARWWYDRYQ